jgi:hypothetical protein
MKKINRLYKILLLSSILNSITNLESKSSNSMTVKDYSKALNKENKVLKKRHGIIKNNLEKALATNIDSQQTPVIAICCSGGGFRSMLATTGFLCGAKEIGLLDVTSYITALSGSSWCLIPWILQNSSIDEFKNELMLRMDNFSQIKKLSHLNLDKLKEIKNFIIDTYHAFSETKKTKKDDKQKASFIDWYGIILTNLLLNQFHEKRFELKLSDLAPKVKTGRLPFPIFTAVSQLDHYKYQWLEFSPLYVASCYLNSSIKPKAFGAKFYNGEAKNAAPEPPLSFLMGIFGSAFSASLKDAIHRLANVSAPKEILKIVQKTEDKISTNFWANKKIFPAQVTNFTYGMQNSPIKKAQQISIVDGGYSCNLPIQPLLQPERKVDIIIVLDNTSTRFMPPAFSLKQAEQDAKEKNQKFPPIDYQKAATQNFSVFKDQNDPTCPTIIYIPLKKDPTYSQFFNPLKAKFCGTTNFFYSKKQAETLTGLTEHTVKKYKDEIWKEVKEKIKNKNYQ